MGEVVKIRNMFKEFEETGQEISRAAPFILATVSYIVTGLALAYLFKGLASLIGSIPFIYPSIGTIIGLPTFIAIWDRMSGSHMLEAFIKNWSALKWYIHILIITTAFIWCGFYNSLAFKTIWPVQSSKN